jgi:hypothetical protein
LKFDKKITILFYLILSFSIELVAQDFFEELPFPDSLRIASAVVCPNGELFIGTFYERGGIYHSMDQGNTWDRILSTESLFLQCLAMKNDSTIYAGFASEDTSIMVTYNTGLTWEVVEMPFPLHSRKISFFGPDTIYICGYRDSGAVLLRSINGGSSWQTVLTTNVEDESFSDIVRTKSGIYYMSKSSSSHYSSKSLYRSINNGNTFGAFELPYTIISCLELNSNDDLIIGIWDRMPPTGWSYTFCMLYHDSGVIHEVPFLGHINSLLVNSENTIYGGCWGYYDGLFYSPDNGQSIDSILINPPPFIVQLLGIDSLDYIYATTDYGMGGILLKSKLPTITSINEQIVKHNQPEISVFPNPACDLLSVKFNSGCSTGYKISIRDIAGKLLFERDQFIGDLISEFNIKMLIPGIYSINVDNGFSHYNSRFIKQ